MRRALLGVAALGSLLLVAACGSDDDDVDTSIPSVESVLDTITPEDSAGPVDSSVTGDTMAPVDTSMSSSSMAPMDSSMTSSSTMTSDTASSATVAP